MERYSWGFAEFIKEMRVVADVVLRMERMEEGE